jgi:hypothetical protein
LASQATWFGEPVEFALGGTLTFLTIVFATVRTELAKFDVVIFLVVGEPDGSVTTTRRSDAAILFAAFSSVILVEAILVHLIRY